MPHFDRPLSELRRYLPEREEPADYDAFCAGAGGDRQTLAS